MSSDVVVQRSWKSSTGRSGWGYAAGLSRTCHRSNPADQEEMMAAEIAPIGQEHPMDDPLNEVADADTPEFNRLAVRTALCEHTLQ